MDKSFIINIIYNITMLLTVALIYLALQSKGKTDNLIYKIMLGVSFGIAGLIIMSTAAQLNSDIIFDTRSILISVSGMFFGLIPTLVAGAMMIIYRIAIGGAGVYMGILVIMTTAIIGAVWHHYRFRKILDSKKTCEFYIFGVVIHIDMLLCMLALPKDQIWSVIENTFLPIIVLYPIGTYLLCILLLNQFTKNDLLVQLKESEEKYRQIAENVTDVIWTTDLNLNTTYISASVEALLGEPVSVYMNKTLEEKFPLEDLNKIRSILQEELKQEQVVNSDKGRSRIIEVKHYLKDGTTIWLSMHVTFMRDENSGIIGFQGVTRNINELKKAEEEKARQAGLIVSLIDSIPDLIFYKDLEGVYLGCNIPFTLFVGKQRNEIIGKTDYNFFNREIADFFRYHDNEMLKQKLPRRNEEWVTYPDGRKVLLETLKTPYLDASGNLIGILGISRDNTERKRKEEEIAYIGYHDHLTGLYNRRFYEEELIKLDVKENLPLSMIMGDVNGLKLINDSFGHSVGDELLRKVANVIKSGCRTDDIIARFGGDEFVILLPKTDSASAVQIIEGIKVLLSKEEIHGIEISASFGYETKKNEAENMIDILRNTENHMYRHKLFESASMRSKAIDIIMNTLYEKNDREMLHSKRVSKTCEEIAAKMNLDSDTVSKIKLAGLMHDIGKIGIDEKILNSPYKLNEDEWNEMKKHSEIGYRILSSANEFSEIAEYVLQHQEKWDGSGYPKGLKGQGISQEARIIAVADAYDAMTSHRTYGEILCEAEALAEISKCSGTQFDPEIVKLFVDMKLAKEVK